MELLNLRIENFGSIGDVSVPLNVEGLILVTGVNKDAPKADSNGSGKSLLFEAICWCLWGETVRGLSGDEVVNLKSGKDCCVALTFREDGKTYTVSRHRLDSRVKKPNDVTISVNGAQLGTTGKMKSMQEVVNQLIGFDFSTFRAMMPGAGIKVANLTDKAIKELLESLLQTEQLADAYESAREKSKLLDNRVSAARTKISGCQQQLVHLNKHLDDILSTKKTIEAETARRVEEQEARIARLVEELTEADTEIATEPLLLAEHKRLAADATQFEHTIQAEFVEPLKAKIGFEANKVRSIEDDLTRAKHNLSLLKTAKIKTTQLAATCDACLQVVPEEHKHDVQTRADQQVKEQEAQIAFFEAALGAAKQVKAEVEAEALNILGTKQQELKTLKQKCVDSANRMQQLANTKKVRSKTQDDLSRERKALIDLTANLPDFAALITEQTDKAALLAKDISVQLGEVKLCEAELKLCGFWVDGFSPSGLRSFMLDYVTPILNDRAQYYCDLLTNGEMSVTFSTKSTLKSGQSKEKFSISCRQNHGSESYAGSSAGERARADLVIAMALGDLAQLRTAKQLPWRFLDEPFESIDQSGTEAIVRLLNDQKTRYRTVFVVTHKPDFKELFSQRLTVVKENGISSLTKNS